MRLRSGNSPSPGTAPKTLEPATRGGHRHCDDPGERDQNTTFSPSRRMKDLPPEREWSQSRPISRTGTPSASG